MAKRVSLFVGKFNPFHEGHKAIVDTLLMEGQRVIICCKRQMSWEEWCEFDSFIDEIFEYNPYVQACYKGEFDDIVHGRKTDYTFRRIKLPKELEEFSSTKIRKGLL